MATPRYIEAVRNANRLMPSQRSEYEHAAIKLASGGLTAAIQLKIELEAFMHAIVAERETARSLSRNGQRDAARLAHAQADAMMFSHQEQLSALRDRGGYQ